MWSTRTLQRNVSSQYYHRLLRSENKEVVHSEMQRLTAPLQDKLEYLKNPVVAEFLGFKNNTDYTESDLEQRIIDHLIPFLMGYFIFSSDAVQDVLGKYWIQLLGAALATGVLLVVFTFGQDNTSPQYLGRPLNCIYGWLACLAMTAWFRARFDRTSAFAGYMTRSSFGIYIVHYLVIAALGYQMKMYTQLPPWSMYAILAVAVFTLSPLIYEIIRRIPFIRWCVLGEKKR